MGKRTSMLNIANDLLKEGKKLRIEAKGYSMYPTIKPGYTVHIEAYDNPAEVAQGDIIAWRKDEKVILHRIVHILKSDNNTSFITRGDSLLKPDVPVQFQHIVGKAIRVESGTGSWVPAPKTFIPEWKYRYNKKKLWFILKLKKLISLLRNG